MIRGVENRRQDGAGGLFETVMELLASRNR